MYSILVNPSAGSGRAAALISGLQEKLAARRLSWQIRETQRPGQGSEIASTLARQNPEGVIVVGGDGTISEAADGLKYTGVPLLFCSCGTGNDFIKSTPLPHDPLQALDIQLDAARSFIDLGSMNDRCFLNVAGTGLDVEVLLCADRYKQHASGLTPYLHGVVDAIRAYRPVTAQVSCDDEPLRETRFTILSIGNGQYIGGGMRAVPGTSLTDGFLDVIEARPLKKWQIGVLMALFIPGLHAKTRLVRRQRVKKLRIIRPGMVINLDGELTSCDDATFSILPSALAVRLPAGNANER